MKNNLELMDSTTLKKLHDVELEIMDEIHRVCEKNNIIYYLAGGSVLGAIRHGGFIPWDDDIDICMPRKDYEKFIEVCKSDLGKQFFLQTDETDKSYGKFIAKIRKNGTVFLEQSVENVDAHKGIFVDIFILDDTPKMLLLQKFFSKMIWMCTGIIADKCGWKKAKRTINFMYKLVGINTVKKFRYKLMTFYNNKNYKYYVNYGSQYGVEKQTFKKEVYGIPKLIKFEDRYFYVPERTEDFLIQLYGADFMAIPPEHKRVCHNPICLEFGE